MGSGVSSFGKKKENTTGAVTAAAVQGSAIKRDDHTNGASVTDEAAFLSNAQSSVPRNADIAANYFNSPDDYTDRFLSNCNTQESPQQNSIDAPYSGRSGQSEGAADAAEMFAHTALSLGMDNDDLLFNLMYFDEGQNASFGAVMNSVQTETLALHSENNTPYKLKPASSSAIDGLHRKTFHREMTITEKGNENDCECAVCKDEIEEGSEVLQLPTCQHAFHEECLLRWIKLQGWCPVCRAPIESVCAGKAQDDIATAGSTPERADDAPNRDVQDDKYDRALDLALLRGDFSGESPAALSKLDQSKLGEDKLEGSKLGSPVARLFDGDDDMDRTVREDSNDYGANSSDKGGHK